jgi:hypothetical protein
MENQQAVSFLASLVEVIVKAVKAEVLESLDKDRLVAQAIHSAVDYDETFWQRITDHVNKQMEGSSNDPSGRNDMERKIDEAIENWSDTYLDEKVGDWMDSNLNDRMDTWMSDNFNLDDYGDIERKVKDVLRDEVSFTVTVDY